MAEMLPVSLRDYVPAAFHRHCVRPRGVNIKYKETTKDCFEFTYTLIWRGTTLPERLPEIAGLLETANKEYQQKEEKQQPSLKTITLPEKKNREMSLKKMTTLKTMLKKKEKRSESASKSCRSDNMSVKGGLTCSSAEDPLKSMDLTQVDYSTPTFSCSSSSTFSDRSFSVKDLDKKKLAMKATDGCDGLRNFKQDLYKKFNCPRYYYNPPPEEDKQQSPTNNAPKTPVVIVDYKTPETGYSLRSYLGVVKTPVVNPSSTSTVSKSRKKKKKAVSERPLTPLTLMTPSRSWSSNIDSWPMARIVPAKDETTPTTKKKLKKKVDWDERSVSMRTAAATPPVRSRSLLKTAYERSSSASRIIGPASDTCSHSKDDKNQEILLQVKLKKPLSMGTIRLEGFFPPEAILSDAVDDLLKLKAQHRLLLKTYEVEKAVLYGYPGSRRPMSHREFFTGTLGELKETDGTIALTVDMRKDEHELVKKFGCR